MLFEDILAHKLNHTLLEPIRRHFYFQNFMTFSRLGEGDKRAILEISQFDFLLNKWLSEVIEMRIILGSQIA